MNGSTCRRRCAAWHLVQAAAACQAEERTSGELATLRDAGVKLFKQVRWPVLTFVLHVCVCAACVAKTKGEMATLWALLALAPTLRACTRCVRQCCPLPKQWTRTSTSQSAHLPRALLPLPPLQIRAVVHALERNTQHFQRVPEVGLCIKQLQDWCTKHGPYWAGVQAAAASAGPRGNDETMTLNLKDMLGAAGELGAH